MWVQSNENTNAFHSQIILFSFCAKWQVNGIGAKGANALGESLKVNTTLTELNLRGKHKQMFITKTCMRTKTLWICRKLHWWCRCTIIEFCIEKEHSADWTRSGWFVKNKRKRGLQKCSVHIALALIHTDSNREQDWGTGAAFLLESFNASMSLINLILWSTITHLQFIQVCFTLSGRASALYQWPSHDMFESVFLKQHLVFWRLILLQWTVV